jgi:hypothetical protein
LKFIVCEAGFSNLATDIFMKRMTRKLLSLIFQGGGRSVAACFQQFTVALRNLELSMAIGIVDWAV